MKFNKLLKKLKIYLDSDADQLRKEDEGLAKVLKKLKKKEHALKAKIAAEKDKDDREQLQQELKVVHSQREKGIKLLATLREKKRK